VNAPVRGRFITLEGGEGAGKTVQSVRLTEALTASGRKVLRTREPGGAPGAELLRGILLDGKIDWAPKAEALLHFAARAEHVAKTIEPALAAGTWVVCDRFFDSTLAYQGYGQGADRDFIRAQARLLGISPDLTLVLDVPGDVAAARLRARGGEADRYEAQNATFHERVREGFRRIARADRGRCVLIDASRDADAVLAAILAAIHQRLE
jgi:dTMP kinase